MNVVIKILIIEGIQKLKIWFLKLRIVLGQKTHASNNKGPMILNQFNKKTWKADTICTKCLMLVLYRVPVHNLYNSTNHQSIKIESLKQDNDHYNVNAFFELTWLDICSSKWHTHNKISQIEWYDMMCLKLNFRDNHVFPHKEKPIICHHTREFFFKWGSLQWVWW